MRADDQLLTGLSAETRAAVERLRAFVFDQRPPAPHPPFEERAAGWLHQVDLGRRYRQPARAAHAAVQLVRLYRNAGHLPAEVAP
jgi:hypothetical protein